MSKIVSINQMNREIMSLILILLKSSLSSVYLNLFASKFQGIFFPLCSSSYPSFPPSSLHQIEELHQM
jgi:hypothetical protein